MGHVAALPSTAMVTVASCRRTTWCAQSIPITTSARPLDVVPPRAAAVWIARAARAAWLGALSTGSSPKTAMSPVGPESSMRPPKLRTFSAITSKARAPSTVDDGRIRARRKARWRRSHSVGTDRSGVGRGRAARARHRLAMSQAVLVHARAERIARDAEGGGGAANVAAGGAEGGFEVVAEGIVQ